MAGATRSTRMRSAELDRPGHGRNHWAARVKVGKVEIRRSIEDLHAEILTTTGSKGAILRKATQRTRKYSMKNTVVDSASAFKTAACWRQWPGCWRRGCKLTGQNRVINTGSQGS